MLVAQSCLTLCDPMDYSLPGSSVHGILQERILEWVAIPSSRGIFLTQGSNLGLLHCRHMLYHLNHLGSPGQGNLKAQDVAFESRNSNQRLMIKIDILFSKSLYFFAPSLFLFLLLCIYQDQTDLLIVFLTFKITLRQINIQSHVVFSLVKKGKAFSP